MYSQKVLSLLEMELNAIDRHICGYVQMNIKSRSRSAHNNSIAEMMS